MVVNYSQTFFDVHKVEEKCTCTKRELHILSGESWGLINLMHGRSTLGYKKLIWLDDTVKRLPDNCHIGSHVTIATICHVDLLVCEALRSVDYFPFFSICKERT